MLWLWAGNQALHGLPYVLDGDGLHTGAVATCLHFAEKKTWLTGGVTPERDMTRIVKWIGAILLWAGRSKDGDNRDMHSRREMHGTTIIANEEIALLKLSCQLSQTCFSCDVYDHIIGSG